MAGVYCMRAEYTFNKQQEQQHREINKQNK